MVKGVRFRVEGFDQRILSWEGFTHTSIGGDCFMCYCSVKISNHIQFTICNNIPFMNHTQSMINHIQFIRPFVPSSERDLPYRKIDYKERLTISRDLLYTADLELRWLHAHLHRRGLFRISRFREDIMQNHISQMTFCDIFRGGGLLN